MSLPNPNTIYPVPNIDFVTYVKPTITNPNIIVGDFTYISEKNFEERVFHHYDFYKDRLIIGKFCQIAKGVRFIMNGVNHQMNAISTFPFYIFEGWTQKSPDINDLPIKGDTIIGNDVWIGENATILPGVKIGNGVIVGMNTVVASDVPNYHIVVGNPATILRKRFDDEIIELLNKICWWDLSINEIQNIIPLLTNSDISFVKQELYKKYILNN